MNRSPGPRIKVLLLTLFVALGMSLSFVQGGLMATEMAVSAEASGPTGCVDCSGGDGGDAGGAMCLSVCGSVAQGLLPGEPATAPAGSQASVQADYLVLGGRSSRPDHGPPKILTLS